MNKQHRRAFFHDYRAPAIYHISIVKHSNIPAFSEITPTTQVMLSDLGKVIVYELFELFKRHTALELYQYVIMPDHIHLLIRIKEPLQEHLGYYIGNLTGAISRHWHAKCGLNFQSVFEDGYNDRIVGPSRSLDALFRYLRDNPRRLAVRRAHPEFFRRVNKLAIEGKEYRAYGNMQLLDNPFKEQVVVHRADSEDTRKRNSDLWLYTAANGGVLVSPFISPAEKSLRGEAENLGGKIILITDSPMVDRYKPAAHDFALCEAGRLLIISITNEKTALSRELCMTMNGLAAAICRNK